MPDKAFSDYFYGDEATQFTYFRIPCQLITHPRFKHLSTDSKLLYYFDGVRSCPVKVLIGQEAFLALRGKLLVGVSKNLRTPHLTPAPAWRSAPPPL